MNGPYRHDNSSEPPNHFPGTFHLLLGHERVMMSGVPAHMPDLGMWPTVGHIEPIFPPYGPAFHREMIAARMSVVSSIPPKRRRTRSGCFTCRQRRVKCDEKRPNCDRCKRGNRECSFPPAPNSLSDAVNSGKVTQSSATHTSTQSNQDGGQAKSQERYPLPEVGTPENQSSHAADCVAEEPQDIEEAEVGSPQSSTTKSWSHLGLEEQELLDFHRDNLTSCHYLFHCEPATFIHNELVDAALSFEPLLDAVLAFSAYHRMFRTPVGGFQSFWELYSRCIVSLRTWLGGNGERHEALVLTIMQVATIEEYMGDWTNLAAHHGAAHSIVMDLYSHATIMSSITSRNIFYWHSRSDIGLSVEMGSETLLEHEWFLAAKEWCRVAYISNPGETSAAALYFLASIHLCCVDTNHAFVRSIQSDTHDDMLPTILPRLKEIQQEIRAFNENRSQMDIAKDVDDRGEATSALPTYCDRSNTNEELRSLDYISVQWYFVHLLHIFEHAIIQCAKTVPVGAAVESYTPVQLTLGERYSNQLKQMAVSLCQTVDVIEGQGDESTATDLPLLVPVVLATRFLPANTEAIAWSRTKLARIECMGYMLPLTLRQSLARLWDDETVMDWWFSGKEDKHPLIDRIRDVVDERERDRTSAGLNVANAHTGKFNAMFNRLNLADIKGKSKGN